MRKPEGPWKYIGRNISVEIWIGYYVADKVLRRKISKLKKEI